MSPATTRARLALTAVVVVALLYGSLCSTTCALGACPTDSQNAATHDCDHGASSPSHHGAPQNPDCPKHHHPTFEAVNTDNFSHSQLAGATRAPAHQLLAATSRGEAAGATSRARSPRCVSPPDLRIPLQQQISALRV